MSEIRQPAHTGSRCRGALATEKLTDEQAFERLRKVSQRTRRKRRDLADDLVYTRLLDA
jgi:ANTAR domain